jgi:hypothetical protein
MTMAWLVPGHLPTFQCCRATFRTSISAGRRRCALLFGQPVHLADQDVAAPFGGRPPLSARLGACLTN